MHITFLTQYYPPEIGAPQARLSELAAHFIQKGHEVSVLTAMPNYPIGKIYHGYGGLLRREQIKDVRIVRTFIFPTQKTRLIPRLTNYFSFVLSSATFGCIFLRPADYLLVESPPLFLGLSGVLLSKILKTRMIFNVSDLWPESAVTLGVLRANSFAYQISARLEKFCYQQAWLISGQSKSILQSIRARFPALSTYHLSNGVNTQMFHPNRHSEKGLSKVVADGKCLALFAGLHGLAQGLDQIVDAAELLQDEEGLKFVLVGEGPEKHRLIQIARERNLKNLQFRDSIPAKDVPPLLAGADIILVTLKVYIPGAVPSKLYEAMASGRPVVLVASGEAAEIVRESQAGIVVKPGDIPALAETIRTLYSQPELRRTYGENGRRAAEQYFDRSMIATRFIEHLEANL